jgi:hypothetical protein
MLVLALGRQSCVNPILLAASVVPHVRVTKRRQFTGSVLGSISSRLGAVDNYVSRLIRQKSLSELRHLIGRQIDRARQMRMMITSRGQSFDKQKRFASINFQFEIIPGNCRYHKVTPSFFASLSHGFKRLNSHV